MYTQHIIPVEYINVLSSVAVITSLKALLPASFDVALNERLVEMGFLPFIIHVFLSHLSIIFIINMINKF